MSVAVFGNKTDALSNELLEGPPLYLFSTEHDSALVNGVDAGQRLDCNLVSSAISWRYMDSWGSDFVLIKCLLISRDYQLISSQNQLFDLIFNVL